MLPTSRSPGPSTIRAIVKVILENAYLTKEQIVEGCHHGSIRSMAQCMAMGQAAGTLAAMATPFEAVRKVDPSDVRARLLDAGAILELP